MTIIRSIGRLSVQFPNGRIIEHTPGRLEIRTAASEASGEGVEGEPVATLGGGRGSPLGSGWCRFCGGKGYEQLTCVECWSDSFEVSMQLTGQVAGKAMAGLASALGQAFAPARSKPVLDSIRSLGLTTEEAAENLEQCGSTLTRLEG